MIEECGFLEFVTFDLKRRDWQSERFIHLAIRLVCRR